MIVAMDKNRLIGADNDMPWHLPNDLQFFKEKTTNHTIIMGRKTFDSIGRVLPNRKHIVLTRRDDTFPNEVTVMRSIADVIEFTQSNPDEEIFIIGGANIYEQFLPYVDRLYITQIEAAFTGDTYFPEFNVNDWKETSRTQGIKDENNSHDHVFIQYDKKR